MLSLLLDEHVSPVVARQLRRKFPGIKVTTLHEWQGGRFLGTADAVFIAEAAKERLTLVSYDQRTIRPLLKSWIEQGVDHAGVIFIDGKTIAPHDFGGLVQSLGALCKSQRRATWKNRVIFLTRPTS